MNLLAAWMVFTAVFTFNNSPDTTHSIELFTSDKAACYNVANYLHSHAALYGISVQYTECLKLETT